MKINLFYCFLVCGFSCNVSTSTFKEGKYLYTVHCSSCHGIQGEGLGSWFPNLKDTIYLNSNRVDLAAWIHYGISNDSNTVFKSRFNLVDMPANKFLQEVEICNILNYLNENYWHQPLFTLEEVILNLNSRKSQH